MTGATTIELSNGTTLPAIGFGIGTKWYKASGSTGTDESLVKAIEDALDVGYTHFDAAEVYGTEKELGEALTKAKVPRENLFITTKVTGGNDPIEHLDASLKKLNLDYVDLYLIHHPFFRGVEDSWGKMEQLLQSGKVKNIGVSNFGVEDINKVLAVAETKPVVNQIEYHPYLQNQTPGIIHHCKHHNIDVIGYGPLVPLTKAEGGPLTTMLKSLANKYKKTEAQILIRWCYQSGVLPITTSSKKTRMQEYMQIFEFELDETDQNSITNAGQAYHHRGYWGERLERK
jgi:2-dehydropantolactone reductase